MRNFVVHEYFGVSDRTIRLSVGLHSAERVIADLDQALRAAKR